MRQPRLIRDSTGGYKLKASLSSGQYQLSLDESAIILLTDQLGLSEQDTVPAPFVPFLVAKGDAWFPNEREIDGVIEYYQSIGTLTSTEQSKLVAYLTESRIKARNEDRVWTAIENSPLADKIDRSDLQIQELPSLPENLRSGSSEESSHNEGSVSDTETNQTQTSKSTSDNTQSPSEVSGSLTDIPGIGDSYAETFRNNGFLTISDIAETPPTVLAEQTSIPPDDTQCIHVGAGEVRGDDGTPIATVADETDTKRATVADAYATIVGLRGDVSDKTAVLRELFSSSESILDLEDQSLYYLYLLYYEGYQDMQSVADASIDELTTVPYITDQAAEIRSSARKQVDETYSEDKTPQNPKDKPTSGSEETEAPYICPDCENEYQFERVLEKHRYSCDGVTNSNNSPDQSEEPPYICPGCGNEYQFERVLEKHRYSCDRETTTNHWEDDSQRGTQQGRSTTGSGISTSIGTRTEFTQAGLSKLSSDDEQSPDSKHIAAKFRQIKEAINDLLQSERWLDEFIWNGSPGSPYVGPPNATKSEYVWVGIAHELYESHGKPTKGLQFEFGLNTGTSRGFFNREVICGLYFGPWAEDSVVSEVHDNIHFHCIDLVAFLSDHPEYVLATQDETWHDVSSDDILTNIDDLTDGFALTVDLTLEDLYSYENIRELVTQSFADVLPLYVKLAGLEEEHTKYEQLTCESLSFAEPSKTPDRKPSQDTSEQSEKEAVDTETDVDNPSSEVVDQQSNVEAETSRDADEETASTEGRDSTDENTSAENHQAPTSDTNDDVDTDEKETQTTVIDEISVNGDFPKEMMERDQWLLWKQTDDGRKIPRAPWETGDALRYVSAMDPANRTSFAEAVRWQSKLPHDLYLAYAITRDDPIVFVDLDDVVIDDEPSPAAQRLIEKADSYTARSTSGTGIHIFVHGSLSDEIKSLTGRLDNTDDQTLEVYDRNRFVAMTGAHLDRTPLQVASADSFLDQLETEYASVSSETPDKATVEPKRDRDELQEIETTSDIQDLFDAINQTRPSDISMRSTKTKEHGDGTYSYDPSWVYSESGTRLGVLDEVWIYREGMIALNALQLVALEEGIITDERAYPEGDAFWDAVDALRDRGAHIPHFEPSDKSVDEIAAEDTEDEIDKWEVAKYINFGDSVRTHIHPYDRDYQERLALELAPLLVDAATSLQLSPAVAYRAAGLYTKGHTAGIVPGAAHECSLGAALRIASIEAGTPRPLSEIANMIGEEPKSIRKKFHRMIHETDLSDTLAAADLIVDPSEYVPYMARKLERDDDQGLQTTVRDLLAKTEINGGSNPMSDVAAAFYVAMRNSNEYSVTQAQVADAASLSKVTIRNNYRKFTNEN